MGYFLLSIRFLSPFVVVFLVVSVSLVFDLWFFFVARGRPPARGGWGFLGVGAGVALLFLGA
jgi:hypothetical protein